jgi:nucleoside-diphosphate-sugar epimerase
MINILSLEDAAEAFVRACASPARGAFNIPGKDTLPLSRVIAESQRAQLPLPGPLLTPLYALRRWIAGFDFHYDMNVRRFHFGGVLDGERARRELGYVPTHSVQWPRSQAVREFATRGRHATCSPDGHGADEGHMSCHRPFGERSGGTHALRDAGRELQPLHPT